MTEQTTSELTFGASPQGVHLVGLDARTPVVRLSLNRPEARNALSVDLCNAITDAMNAAEDFDRARVIVVSGEGAVFCAGADFAAVSGPGGLDFLPAFERMLVTVRNCRLPVVAAVHGAALGGGLQLAIACDFRVVARDAKLGIPSARLGIVVNFENVQRLVLLVGPAVARRVMMTAETFTGDEALDAGLADVCVEPTDLDAAAADYAGRIAGLAPLSVQGSKTAINAVLDHLSGARASRPEDVAEVDRLVEEAYRSTDLAEGLAAMGEKRKPDFKGR